jgi:membrane complex biogenesis BtpA family protein
MWNRRAFAELVQPPVIGMVHLPPLPGAPQWNGDMAAAQREALAAATALASGGVGALLLENYHDTPFYPGAVPPETVASMAVLAAAVGRAFPGLPLGVNVLRNDASAALAIARASGARFIRVNVHAGAVVTDQGLLQGQAHRTLRLRRLLLGDIGILADVHVKHAAPLAPRPVTQEALEVRQRAGADGLILTGPATGAAADPEQFVLVRKLLPDCPLLVGSGTSSTNVADYAAWVDGYIIGTAVQTSSGSGRPIVDAQKVAHLVAEVMACRRSGGERTC